MRIHRATTLKICLSIALTTGSGIFSTYAAADEELQRPKISSNGRYLTTTDGRPFFWLGDTAWQLFVALDRDETCRYLDNRAEKRFNVIQAVLLSEYGHVLANRGLGKNRDGHAPLNDSDPAKPRVINGPRNDYWDHVDFVIQEARKRDLYVGLLPAWGCNYVSGVSRGSTPIFNEDNARQYGRFLGERYRDSPNVIWILGGDDDPVAKQDVRPVYRAMAEGIATGVTGKHLKWDTVDPAWDELLMCFHPRGGKQSSSWLHEDVWLDFNMLQVGHGGGSDNPNSYLFVTSDRARKPPKPVLDAEPPYEDHPNWREWRKAKPAVREQRRFRAFDVRQAAYWSILSGACGHTYGHHAVWSFYGPSAKAVNFPDRPWTNAIDRPGAAQMRHVRDFFEANGFHTMQPDRSWIIDRESPYVAAAKGESRAIAYFPHGKQRSIKVPNLAGTQVQACWFDPRTGDTAPFSSLRVGQTVKVDPPGETQRGNDWLLVLSSAPSSAR